MRCEHCNGIATVSAACYFEPVIFLPIVQRELRVAAGKRSTMWVRLGGALAALVLGSLGFAVQIATGPTSRVGASIFGMLTIMACFAALSAGLTFTSDSLSEEKREGTLGFLFLTDLRGYDVVSGKLLAAALRGFYMLLAAFPIVAIPLLMGGVSGVAFWKTCLALLNALFASLVAGVFISSISRESQKALLGTMGFMFAWCGAGYLIDVLTSNMFFRFTSPFFVFARASRSAFFWEALIVNQVFAWMLFVASCHFATRTWHDKPDKSTSALAAFGHWFKYGSARRRERLRLKLMDLNPVAWLACRERWQAVSFWAIGAFLIGALLISVAQNSPAFRNQVWSVVATILTLVLYLGFASQSCRFFVDARRNTVLELLLSTPLSSERIVSGQWTATVRMFGPPLVLFIAIHFLGTFIVQQSTPKANPFQSFGVSAAGVLVIAADLATLTWFGMWMGLVSKNANSAAWKTIFFVQILPWIGLSFASGIVMAVTFVPKFGRNPTAMAWMQFISSAIATIGSLAVDWWLYRFARRKLSADLRPRALPV